MGRYREALEADKSREAHEQLEQGISQLSSLGLWEAERKDIALARLHDWRVSAEYADDETTMGAIDRILRVFG